MATATECYGGNTECEGCWDVGGLAISDCTGKKGTNNLRVLPSQRSLWPENQSASVMP